MLRISEMGGEIFPPKRRYKEFRPRQGARGMKQTTVPVNLATVGIFNNTTGAQYLVVRDLTVNGTVSDLIAVSYANQAIGTSQGLVRQLVPSMATQVGLIASIDTATVYPGDYLIALSTTGVWEWVHDFPLAVLEPGWSLVFQDQTAAHALEVSAVWETINSDELDWVW